MSEDEKKSIHIGGLDYPPLIRGLFLDCVLG